MFTQVTRYLGIRIFISILLTEFTLVGLAATIKAVEQLSKLGVGDYNAHTLILYVVFSIPQEAVILFPMAALIGCLLGLGNLASSRELVMMQVIGYSKLALIRTLIAVTLPLMLMHMAIDEYIGPALKKRADQTRAAALSGGQMTFSAYGIWARSDQEYIHIDRIKRDGRLIGLTIYQVHNEGQLQRVRFARSAIFNQDHWILNQATEVNLSSPFSIRTERQEQTVWQTRLTPVQLGVVSIDPDELSISGLREYIHYLQSNQQDSGRYQLEFWRKITSPMSVIAMLLLASSFVFASARHIAPGAQLLIGILVGFTFYVFNQLFGSLSLVYGLWPLLGSILPSMLFLCVAILRLQGRFLPFLGFGKTTTRV